MGRDTLDPTVAYLAGFLDGEGYFDYRRTEVKVDVVDPGPLHVLQRYFGGKLVFNQSTNEGRWRGYWRWRVYGDDARRLCSAVFPWLITKAAEAEALVYSGMPPEALLRRTLNDRAQDNREAEYPPPTNHE